MWHSLPLTSCEADAICGIVFLLHCNLMRSQWGIVFLGYCVSNAICGIVFHWHCMTDAICGTVFHGNCVVDAICGIVFHWHCTTDTICGTVFHGNCVIDAICGIDLILTLYDWCRLWHGLPSFALWIWCDLWHSLPLTLYELDTVCDEVFLSHCPCDWLMRSTATESVILWDDLRCYVPKMVAFFPREGGWDGDGCCIYVYNTQADHFFFFSISRLACVVKILTSYCF